MNMNEISPRVNPRLKRIKKVSGVFKAVFFALTLAMAFVILCTTAVIVWSAVECFRYGWTNYHRQVLHGGLALGTNIISGTFTWSCYKLFDLYFHGNLFTGEIVCCIRRIGVLFFFMAFGGFLCEWVLPHPVDSSQWLEFADSIFNVAVGLFSGFLILFIAWVMDEGRKIQEEQELTV